MAKTITIKEKVYAELINVKKEDESFSDLFERLIKSATPIEVLTKIRGSVKFKNKSKMLAEMYAKRAEMRS
jgi:predicted CopG family antitoxin